MDITLERIIEEMKLQNAKNADLGNFIGVSANVITDWKSGRIKSYTKYLYAIAEFLDVSVEYLKGETDEKKPASKNTASGDDMFSDTDRKIFEALANMSQSDKEWFLAMIETIKTRRG